MWSVLFSIHICICGKHADLKGICDHFQFQNAYMQPLNCPISHGKFTAKFSPAFKIKNESLKSLDYCGKWLISVLPWKPYTCPSMF